MQMHGSRVLNAPRSDVWELLAVPPRLRDFIPGCECLVARAEGDGYDATIATRIGPVSARFKGTFVVEAPEAPRSYLLRFQGQGGTAGFASGEARVELQEQGMATLLTYTVDARIGGKLAQLGSRLIDASASKLADEFFSRMAASFDAQPTSIPPANAEGSERSATAPTRKPALRLRWAVALLALIAFAAIWWLAGAVLAGP